MQTAMLRVIDQNRNQADATPNHYGVIDISGNGSTILGNVYQNYYTQARDQQEPEHAPTNCSRNVHWTINRSKNPYFTGRLDLIDKISRTIRDALTEDSRIEQCRIVITGMGGQGKSEICLQLAHRLRSLFWAVWWVDVSTRPSAQSDFQVVADHLRMPDSTIDDVRRALANLKDPWLLILDNADDIEVDYLQYFPTGHTGVVLLNSRNSECKQHGISDTIALDGLPLIDARELLFKAAQIPHYRRHTYEQDAEYVASFLLGHPLATIQAGAYIQRGHCSLAEYSQVFQRNRKRLLKFRPAQARSRYGDVYASFEASADAIRSMGIEAADDALQFLSMLAMLSSHQLPLSLFEQSWKLAKQTLSPNDSIGSDFWRSADLQAISFLPEFIGATEESWDSFRLLEAVRLLEAYSLVTTDDVEGTKVVSMHPLAHAWAKDRQDNTLMQQSWVMVACSISVSSLNHRQTLPLDVWDLHQQQLRPHILALVNAEDDIVHGCGPQAMIVCILNRCGSLLADSGLNDQLSELMRNVFSWLSIDTKTVDPKWLPLYQFFARKVLIHHRPHEAISLQEQVVTISEQGFPGTDESRALWPWYLAKTYIDYYEYEKAAKVLEKVLLEIEHKPLEQNRYDLRIMNELAEAYCELGQTEKAELLLEKIAIKTNGQELDPHHRDRLDSLAWLADTYRLFGQYHKAISTLEQVVAIREKTLAESHPDRMGSQSDLAINYIGIGEFGKATLIFEELFTIQERILVKSHPDLLSTQYHLGRAYHESGKLQEAIVVLEGLVKIEGQIYAESNRNLLCSQYELARTYVNNREASKAVEILERVAEIDRSTLVDNEDWVRTLVLLASAYRDCGLQRKAARIFEEIVRIDECRFPEDSPKRSTHLVDLAIAYYDIDRLGDAIRLMQSVVKVQRQVLENQDPVRERSERWLSRIENRIMSRALDKVRKDHPLEVIEVRHQDENSILNAKSCPGTPVCIDASNSRPHVWLDDMVYIKPSSIGHRGFYIDDAYKDDYEYNSEYYYEDDYEEAGNATEIVDDADDRDGGGGRDNENDVSGSDSVKV